MQSERRTRHFAETAVQEEQPHWWYLPVLAILIGIAGLGASTALLMDGVEPFATWYYNFAWYPVLLAGDGIVALTGGAGRGRRGGRSEVRRVGNECRTHGVRSSIENIQRLARVPRS